MAMIKCPECKKDISSKAVFCPHCGCPINYNVPDATYELEQGAPEASGFSTLLTILGWITWVGGAIIAYSAANAATVGSYSSTGFSIGTFLTVFLPFLIDGMLLMGMSSMAERIANTNGRVSGMRLVKIPAQSETPMNQRTSYYPAMRASQTQAKLADGWFKDSSGLYTCPKCNIAVSPELIKQKNACPRCGYAFYEQETDEQNELTGSADNPDMENVNVDEYGWIIDKNDQQIVQCPNCGKRVFADYMRTKIACPECRYVHKRTE